MLFQVWQEWDNGAIFLGEAEAETFNEACAEIIGNKLDEKSLLTAWGRRLYDNRADAVAHSDNKPIK